MIPVSIPRYNNENRWYIEKYQSILNVFEEGELAARRQLAAVPQIVVGARPS